MWLQQVDLFEFCECENENSTFECQISSQLPWKSLKSIVEYYYMWKTTDRYVQQKRLKAAEAESKLKQVYIPT